METVTLIALLSLILTLAGADQQCGHPAIPPYARVTVNGKSVFDTPRDQRYHIGTVAEFSCDGGYEIIGNPSIICSGQGTWQGELPSCGINVALGKIANQSSTVRGGSASNAVDGNLLTEGDSRLSCSQTGEDSSPWWIVDLMETYVVTAVKVTSRPCCDFQLRDLEIRVGNSTTHQRNPLCTWFPGPLDERETQAFRCSRPLIGRYVSVEMVGVKGSLSLCEVQVISPEDIPRESCVDSSEPHEVITFNRTCYEAHLTEGKDFAKARASCRRRNGELWNSVPDSAMELLIQLFEQKKSTMKSQMVWLGVEKEPVLTSKTWLWITGDVVERPQWGKDQPNNYNGEQNCVVLDGARDWLWNDVGCNLDYFHWVCKFSPLGCGSPDRSENSTIRGSNFTVGATIEYQCPTGSATIGSHTRTCTHSGVWTNTAPTCKYIDCGPLDNPDNGLVLLADQRTTFNATAQYSCDEDHSMIGSPRRTCTVNGTWEPSEPKCLARRCQPLPLFERGTFNVTGLNAGDSAIYSCDPAHKLVGDKILQCELGGQWSSPPPRCVFVDCGMFSDVSNGRVELLNGSTTLSSVAVYSCDEDYELNGKNTRICQENGRWSGIQPTCTPIECDEPEVPVGGYVVGFDFTVYSEIRYYCEQGYLLSGNDTRVCTQSGSWSGEPPTCLYIDCLPVTEISHGKVVYSTGTTSLGSVATYLCDPTYKLEGNSTRTCNADGQWTGVSPYCREIRCPLPERPPATILSISTSDRLKAVSFIKSTDREAVSSTFRVGSNVIYKCERGFRLEGNNARVCQSGVWTGEPPSCTFVDCGLPEGISHGFMKFPNNDTHMGSYVQYSCETNYRLIGFERRVCLENGSWSGEKPRCQRVTCQYLAADPDSGLLISVSSESVGGVVSYKCLEGRRLVGPSSRKCQNNGQWEDYEPICELIDCQIPPDLPNGRVFLVNGTTTYGSLAEYHCVPGSTRLGLFARRCTASGDWSGPVPVCVPETEATPVNNQIEELTSEKNESGEGSAVWVGVGAAAALVFLLLVGLIYYKMKEGSWTWTKSVHPTNAASANEKIPSIQQNATPRQVSSRSALAYPAGHVQRPESAPESLHLYHVTERDTQKPRRNQSLSYQSHRTRPMAPPPLPPNAVTVNGMVMGR